MRRFTSVFFMFLILTVAFYGGLSGCGSGSNATTGTSSPTPTPTPTPSDSDSDGVADTADCAPADNSISPSVTEIAGDGIDQDCTGNDKKILKITTSGDNNNDGVYDLITVEEFSATGKLLSRSYSGSINSTQRNTYDSNDNLIEEAQDFGNNGTIDSVTDTTYNANNKPLTIQTDISNDGTINSEVQFDYDADGNILEQRFFTNGVLVRKIVKTYNLSGDVAEEIYDDATAVNVDYKTTYAYNSDNLLLESTTSVSAGGGAYTFQNKIVYTYDANGKPTIINADSTPVGPSADDRIRYHTYDSEGEVLTSSEDSGGNGTIDFFGEYVKTVNPDGSILSEFKADQGNNGTVDYTEYYVHTATGLTLEYGDINNLTGNYYKSFNTLDEFGSIIKTVTKTFDPTSPPEEVYLRVYEFEYSE